MKTARKAILLAICVVLLVAASVMGTLAYFTDSEAVTNTFSVGKVYIELDEYDFDNDDNKADNTTVNGETRDKANQYHLLPGQTYKKDPTIRVKADSENCYLFVTVDNGIANLRAEAEGDKSVAAQMTVNGWKPLSKDGEQVKLANVPVYVYKEVVKKAEKEQQFVVFGEFTVDGDKVVSNNTADGSTTVNITDLGKAKIVVTGYAIQEAGFDDALTAWTALAGQLNLN